MTLDEAIAEVKRVTTDSEPWVGDDFGWIFIRDTRTALAAILNAVASGEIVKRALADHGPTARIDAAKS